MKDIPEVSYRKWLDRLDNYSPANETRDMINTEPFRVSDIDPSSGGITENVAVITKSMVVDGNIKSGSALYINGRVNGNVQTETDAGVSGIVVGNVRAKNVAYNHAGVRGNTDASGNVTLENDSAIVGDIKATDILVEGKVKGKIRAEGIADIRSNTLIIGSIEAGRIQIADGARVNASISIIDSSSTGNKADDDFVLEV